MLVAVLVHSLLTAEGRRSWRWACAYIGPGLGYFLAALCSAVVWVFAFALCVFLEVVVLLVILTIQDSIRCDWHLSRSNLAHLPNELVALPPSLWDFFTKKVFFLLHSVTDCGLGYGKGLVDR